MWYPTKYGADDFLGAMNLITSETILAAISIVQKGIVYDLSHDLDQDMPIPGFHGAFFANTQFTLENGAEWHDRHLGMMKNGYSAQNLRIAMSDHSGTHIDQLNRVGIRQPDGEYLIYNGIRNRDVITRLCAGVVTSPQPIRYPSKRKVRHYQCISRCLQKPEFDLWRTSTWTRLQNRRSMSFASSLLH